MIKELRFWVQKVLPLVYDDSLSYMELLNRVCFKLNEVIDLANGIDESITQQVNDIMNEWVEDGTFEELINQTALGDLNDKVDGVIGDVEALDGRVDDAEDDIDSLEGRVAELEANPGSVVTPQVLGYPDTKTADEAFAIMATYTNNPIVIPEATYDLSNEYVLENVVIDMGTYNNYVPMYKRKNTIDFSALGAGTSVTLPHKTSYTEAGCKLGDNYYCVNFGYSGTDNYVCKYNTQFSLVIQADIDSAVMEGPPSNIYTDGTYIYIDMSGHGVLKYDTSLNLVQSYANLGFHSSGYFNGSFWGIGFSYPNMYIYKLNSNFTILDSHVINRGIPNQDIQSFTVHNGMCYVPTTVGYITVVDMFDWSYELIYYNSQLEIENITFIDGEPCYFGHDYGVDGKFMFGAFNGGVTVNYFGKYEFDGDDNRINLNGTNLWGVYKFTNYAIDNFGNSGTLIVMDDIILAKINPYLFIYDKNSSKWRFYGSSRQVSVTLDTGLYLVVYPNGKIGLFAHNYNHDFNESTIDRDNTDIFKLLDIGTSHDRSVWLLGRNAATATDGSFCAMRVTMTSTRFILRPTSIKGTMDNGLYNGFSELTN